MYRKESSILFDESLSARNFRQRRKGNIPRKVPFSETFIKDWIFFKYTYYHYLNFAQKNFLLYYSLVIFKTRKSCSPKFHQSPPSQGHNFTSAWNSTKRLLVILHRIILLSVVCRCRRRATSSWTLPFQIENTILCF